MTQAVAVFMRESGMCGVTPVRFVGEPHTKALGDGLLEMRLKGDEMPMLDSILNARAEAGLTQAQVA